MRGLNAGPAFQHSESFSFQLATDDQAETDRSWNAIIDNAGEASGFGCSCGWRKGRWNVPWQIKPNALIAAIVDPD